jgi:hypothetical protein
MKATWTLKQARRERKGKIPEFPEETRLAFSAGIRLSNGTADE